MKQVAVDQMHLDHLVQVKWNSLSDRVESRARLLVSRECSVGS